MQTGIDGLLAIGAERPSFAPAFETRAFLLERPDGNILAYATGRMSDEVEAMRSRGGVWRQFLNHSHQADPACDLVSSEFGAPLWCHEADAAEARKKCRVDHASDGGDVKLADFEIVPTPGHTPGSVCFLWTANGRRMLFSGDTIFLRDGRWIAAVLDGISDRDAYIASLERIAETEFDVLVPSFSNGEPLAIVDEAERRRQVEDIARRLRAGEDN